MLFLVFDIYLVIHSRIHNTSPRIIITYCIMAIIPTTKGLILSHDEVGVAYNVVLKDILSIKTCHFHQTVLITACYKKEHFLNFIKDKSHRAHCTS